jgi:hypothetical protein
VLGEPGAGKTTWAKQLSWLLAADRIAPASLGLPRDVLPVLLRLRNLEPGMIQKSSDPVEALKAFLSRETSSKATPEGQQDPTEELWNHPGGLLWILDGLDAAHQRVHGITDKARQKALDDRQSLTAVLKTAPYQAPSMREMVTNPLLLTILCVVYHEEHNLPTARANRKNAQPPVLKNCELKPKRG